MGAKATIEHIKSIKVPEEQFFREGCSHQKRVRTMGYLGFEEIRKGRRINYPLDFIVQKIKGFGDHGMIFDHYIRGIHRFNDHENVVIYSQPYWWNNGTNIDVEKFPFPMIQMNEYISHYGREFSEEIDGKIVNPKIAAYFTVIPVTVLNRFADAYYRNGTYEKMCNMIKFYIYENMQDTNGIVSFKEGVK